ncbi:hypothetical protein ACUN0C_05050 [Faunimonas sp. B44]|uniref:hypothetical protein n=1 Tax=Faunimonas sp. B44 TaxID=3461493 RepID=UPI004044A483
MSDSFRFRRFVRAASAAAILLLGGAGHGFAQSAVATGGSGPVVSIEASGGEIAEAAASVTVTGRARAIRAAGALLDVQADVERDLQVAGAEVSVAGSVGGKLQAAGAIIDVTGRAGGDVNLAGAVVNASIVTAGDMRAIGARVTIAPGTEVAGDLWAGGALVSVAGHVAGDAEISASVLTLSGRIDGTVTVAADRIVVAPGAVLGGDLVFQSDREPEIRPGAQVAGAVRADEPKTWGGLPGWATHLLVALFIAGAILVAGIVLYLLARGAVQDGAAAVGRRPLASAALGVLAAVAIPVLALLLMMTGLGAPVGFALLLVLPFVLLAGLAVAAMGLAGWRRSDGPPGFGRTLLMLLLGGVVLGLVWVVPVVGGWLVLVAVLVGTGAFLNGALGRLRRPAII